MIDSSNGSPRKLNLVDALWWRHGRLDCKRANVLPSLFEEGHEVVDSQHDVSNELILSHADISNSDTHAENLLQLELDGALDISDLVGQIFSVADGCWEFAGFGETGSEETGNLFDEGVGCDEGIVLASELLDKLLVLVKLLQVVGAHGINTVCGWQLRLIDDPQT
jgi:hypothetical protein